MNPANAKKFFERAQDPRLSWRRSWIYHGAAKGQACPVEHLEMCSPTERASHASPYGFGWAGGPYYMAVGDSRRPGHTVDAAMRASSAWGASTRSRCYCSRVALHTPPSSRGLTDRGLTMYTASDGVHAVSRRGMAAWTRRCQPTIRQTLLRLQGSCYRSVAVLDEMSGGASRVHRRVSNRS